MVKYYTARVFSGMWILKHLFMGKAMLCVGLAGLLELAVVSVKPSPQNL